MTRRATLRFAFILLFSSVAFNALSAAEPSTDLFPTFEGMVEPKEYADIGHSLDRIYEDWDERFIPAILELLSLSNNSSVSNRLLAILLEKTGQDFGYDINAWFKWVWNRPELITNDYAQFKAHWYRQIDPIFETYFLNRQGSAQIRLDEIRWGGVRQDGIPPLRQPKMITAEQADYLDDDNVVFGIEINGDARAYPKRILAWHEMFVDTIGGVEIAGVYCTLCGSVIPYKTTFKGDKFELGTSGFLYRSNKLMYDKATQSLWNTLTGQPVVGPLVGKGIELSHLSVVTTTWKAWKQRHPDTQVLSLDTGYRRDYGEGVAYQDYFATDQLMFNTPFDDTRLNNKQEVLALRFAAAPNQQLAIDTDFLRQHPVYHNQIGRQKLVVFTDYSGANRVYDPKSITFEKYDGKNQVTDTNGQTWRVYEAFLLRESDQTRLPSLPYHRAFWFGWRAAFPETKLIKSE